MKPLKNATLKKRVMTALVSSTAVLGTVAAVAPSASAAVGDDPYMTVNAYQKLDRDELAQYMNAPKSKGDDWSINLLPTNLGPGWCVDWGLGNGWKDPSAGYEPRKLTGASGRVGDGYEISENVRLGAINTVKKLQADYDAYAAGDTSLRRIQAIKTDEIALRALLGNDLGALNAVRGAIYNNQKELSDLGERESGTTPVVSNATFEQITGFKVVDAGSGAPRYRIVPNQQKINEFKGKYSNGEYVTILVPKNYNFSVTKNRTKTFQRIVPIEQPGLNPEKPKWEGTITEWTTPPAITTTQTLTLPPQTETRTVEQPPKEVVTTRTYPATTVTETSTLPTQTVTTRVTTPGREVTKTITPEAVTTTVTTTENGTPGTKVVTTTPKAYTTVVNTPGKPTTVTETVTAETKTVTKEPSTVLETVKTTPVKTTVETQPATTEVLTKTVTPAPVSVTETVVHNENYYVEKVYESVKEVREYYNFAGFTEGEKSKEIELPGNLGDSWTFEIIKGGDIVTVERTDEGKLNITPKPGFKGEGDVEILITDDQGNQYVYKVKVSDVVNVQSETKVIVNNFFYTINPASGDRVRVIEKNKKESYDFYVVDENGNRIKPKPGSIVVDDPDGNVTVEVKDPSFRGNVVVRVTEENGNVRENIVTVESSKTKFDVERELLNTSTAVIERRGGSFEIIEGEDKVEITESKDGETWVVTPDKDATGQVKVVFTDENGVKYNYTLNIVDDQRGMVERIDDINQEDSATIKLEDGWTWEVVDNTDSTGDSQLADIEEKDGFLAVKPKSPYGGDLVVLLKDKNGQQIGTWTVKIQPARDFNTVLPKEDRERDVVDRSIARVWRGWAGDKENGIPANTLEITEGEDLLTDDSKIEGGDFELHFKPDAKGTVRVVEKQARYVNDELTFVPVTEYIYNVKPAQVRELNYTITADNALNLAGSNLTIVKGKELFALADDEKLPEDGADKIDLDLLRNAEGKIVIENRTDDGYLFERYTIDVTPGREAEVKPIKRTMSWNAKAEVNFNEVKGFPDTVKWIEGEDLVNVTEGDKTLEITGKEGQTGTVIFEVEDKRGTWARYELEITEPKFNAREYTVSTNSQFVATLVKEQNQFLLVQGSEFFETPVERNGQWILQPKQDAAGKTGIVEERNPNGDVINRYRVIVTQGAVAQTRDVRTFLVEGEARKFTVLTEGNTFVVVSGAENVDYTTENGELAITAKPGTAGKKVRVEEHNSNGDVVRTILFTIVPEGAVSAEGNTIGENKDFPGILNIDNSTTAGEVKVEFQPGIKELPVLGGAVIPKPRTDGKNGVIWEITDEGRAEIEKCIADKKAKGEKIEDGDCGLDITYLAINDNDDQSYGPTKVTVKVDLGAEVTGNTQTETRGSSELDGKCIAGIVGLTAPLLLAIPLGILSQVQIPGLEGVSAQINGAIQDANNRIQQGLGIYNEDRAQRAAGIQGAFSIENPEQLGMAAGALGAISLGLLAVDGVMRACGAEEYTSSYMIGKATGSETLMNGSSGKSDNKSTDKAEGEAEGSSNEEK